MRKLVLQQPSMSSRHHTWSVWRKSLRYQGTTSRCTTVREEVPEFLNSVVMPPLSWPVPDWYLEARWWWRSGGQEGQVTWGHMG